MDWGDSIYAKFTATNDYGTSEFSPEGNGAQILTNPYVPINLAEDLSSKSETAIGLTWSDGVANGGSVIIDYRVSYDQAAGVFIVLQANILTQSYVATGLTAGETYTFRVEARNIFDYSDYSAELEVICGFNPA